MRFVETEIVPATHSERNKEVDLLICAFLDSKYACAEVFDDDYSFADNNNFRRAIQYRIEKKHYPCTVLMRQGRVFMVRK